MAAEITCCKLLVSDYGWFRLDKSIESAFVCSLLVIVLAILVIIGYPYCPNRLLFYIFDEPKAEKGACSKIW